MSRGRDAKPNKENDHTRNHLMSVLRTGVHEAQMSVVGRPTSTRFKFVDGYHEDIPNFPPGAVLTAKEVSRFKFRRLGENVASETQPGYLFTVANEGLDRYRVWARRADGLVAETHIPEETELEVFVTGDNYIVARFGHGGVHTRQSLDTTLAIDVPYERLDFVHESFPAANHTMTIDIEQNGNGVPPELDERLRTDTTLRNRFKTLLFRLIKRVPRYSTMETALFSLLDRYT